MLAPLAWCIFALSLFVEMHLFVGSYGSFNSANDFEVSKDTAL